MTKSNRKKAEPKEGHSSRRGGVLRRTRRKDEEGPPQGKPNVDPRSTKAAKGSDDRTEGDENVSSLLETTGEDVKQLLEAAGDASKQIREAAQAEAGDKGDGQARDAGEGSSGIGRINKEVQEVLESADEAAEKIREEARGQARQLLEDAKRRAESASSEHMDRVSQMTEQVLGELSAVQGQLEKLQSAFDQAIKAMSANLGVEETDQVWETQQNGAVESDEETDDLRRRLGRRPRRKSVEQPKGISEGARLLALQQLMAGVDAEVIEARLKDEFGVEDPRPLLEWMGVQGATPKQPQKPKKR
jgi:vacuolar-type H+-ATPase subunit H